MLDTEILGIPSLKYNTIEFRRHTGVIYEQSIKDKSYTNKSLNANPTVNKIDAYDIHFFPEGLEKMQIWRQVLKSQNQFTVNVKNVSCRYCNFKRTFSLQVKEETKWYQAPQGIWHTHCRNGLNQLFQLKKKKIIIPLGINKTSELWKASVGTKSKLKIRTMPQPS